MDVGLKDVVTEIVSFLNGYHDPQQNPRAIPQR